MKTITIEDCEELYNGFIRYADNAEQYKFPTLIMVDLKLQHTIEKYKEAGCIEDQEEARAMFRVLLKIIGKDCSEYEEEKESNPLKQRFKRGQHDKRI